MSARQKVTDEEIAAALFIYGTQRAAAEVLLISAHALRLRVRRAPKLRKLVRVRAGMPRKYTDEQIVRALDGATSLRDAMSALLGRQRDRQGRRRRDIGLDVIRNRASSPAVEAALHRLAERRSAIAEPRRAAARARRQARAVELEAGRLAEQKCRQQLQTWSAGRDAFILQWGGEVTNQFLGNLFGISRERVRQIRSDK